jgi:hypothetical protein
MILYGFLMAAVAGLFGVGFLEATMIKDLVMFMVIGGICGALLGFFKPEGVL